MISVIIPTCNRPAQLNACLHAFLVSAYPRDCFEIIVVDDGSAEFPDSIITPYQTALNIKLIQQANAGPAAARNAGAAAASGRWLAFVDDDCRVRAGWLDALAAALAERPTCLIGGRVINGCPDNRYAAASHWLTQYVVSADQTPTGHHRFFPSNNIACSAEQFAQLGGFDTSFPLAAAEDRDFCDRWLARGWPLAYAPSAVITHHHDLTLASFWQQQVNYGRGARQLQALRVAHPRQAKTSLTFYMNLLLFPLRQQLPFSYMLLFLLSQLGIVVGYFTQQRPSR